MFTSLPTSLFGFAIGAVVIAVAGSQLAKLGDELADRTGLGEALFGVVLLAGVTSLPDFAATLSAAVDARSELAMSNVMGSMAANLVFLVIADIAYRNANLEHAAASPANLMLAGLLIVLVTLPLLAVVTPSMVIANVHPFTPAIVIFYLFGLHLVHHTQANPMWYPRHTDETVPDKPEAEYHGSLAYVWVRFALLALITGGVGWILMEAAKEIADQTGLSDSLVGGLFTAVATSTPELVTTLAAIRFGALTMAVSNIIGTNCFNILVVAAADLAYPGNSIYSDMPPIQMIWGLVSILMTAILLLGLVRRKTYGVGRIGFESIMILSVYLIALIIIVINN